VGILQIFGTGLGATQIFVLLVAWIIAITVAIVSHEFMHAWVAYKNGDYTAKAMGRLTLNPVKHFDAIGFLCLLLIGFGWAKPVPINENNFRNIKKGRIWVSLAGVLTNFVLAIVFTALWVLCFYFLDSTILILEFITYLCLYLAYVNLFLGLFNLIPIYPLDGYNFIASFLPYNSKFCMFMRQYGTLLLFAVLIIFTFVPYGISDWVYWIFAQLANFFSWLYFI